jgi:glucose-6-phosphate 1-dehydrogenase
MNIPSHIFTIFGASGDLTKRKILPALFHLFAEGRIGSDCIIVGTGRNPMDDEAFRDLTLEALAESGLGGGENAARWCTGCVFYHCLGDGSPDNYRLLGERLAELEKDHGLPGNRIFYLALPPEAFPPVIENIGEAGLSACEGWSRLVVEKPFGRDLDSAVKLNEHVHSWFDEDQVYRIDHYLGKETVQNLLVFRFANAMFESIWNRDRIDHIQITVAESLGVGHRARYYDTAGAVRDMVQNHIAQLLALITMEVPGAFEARAIMQEKVKVLRSIMPLQPEDIILGQYDAGNEMPGYRDEEGIGEDSATPTFAAIRLYVDTWRWKGTPIYIRTGKRMPVKTTQISVVFESPPVCFFQTMEGCTLRPNVLNISIQPDESFTLSFDVKKPGEPFTLEPQDLHFSYADTFGRLPDAYETLLLDIMTGDQTLFVHADEVEASWKLFGPALDPGLLPARYAAGTWGPDEAAELLFHDGRAWSVRRGK